MAYLVNRLPDEVDLDLAGFDELHLCLHIICTGLQTVFEDGVRVKKARLKMKF
jgi:hypothetical protein